VLDFWATWRPPCSIGSSSSGLPAGSLTESIPVSDVTGPYKGERVCYVCEFETDPNVLAFFRDTSEETRKLIVELNRIYVKNSFATSELSQ